MIIIDKVKTNKIENTSERLDDSETSIDALNQTLSIAHYNLGVQYEFTSDYHSAKEAYEEAKRLAYISINTEHLLT